MKLHAILLQGPVFFMLAATLSGVPSAAAFELRTWTSTSGSTIEGEFVRREMSLVILKKADGAMSRIPYTRLSIADQQYVTEMSKPGATTGLVEADIPDALKTLFGEDLYDADKKKVSTATLKDKVIGVYFSASWCGPCKQFTPVLIETYEELKKGDKPFEIVLVTSDRSKKDAFDYMEHYDMPWLTVKFDSDESDELKKKYGSNGIPHLTIIDDQGKVLSREGRGDVSSRGAKAFSKWK